MRERGRIGMEGVDTKKKRGNQVCGFCLAIDGTGDVAVGRYIGSCAKDPSAAIHDGSDGRYE